MYGGVSGVTELKNFGNLCCMLLSKIVKDKSFAYKNEADNEPFFL